jgi:hypothetical protein
LEEIYVKKQKEKCKISPCGYTDLQKASCDIKIFEELYSMQK